MYCEPIVHNYSHFFDWQADTDLHFLLPQLPSYLSSNHAPSFWPYMDFHADDNTANQFKIVHKEAMDDRQT